MAFFVVRSTCQGMSAGNVTKKFGSWWTSCFSTAFAWFWLENKTSILTPSWSWPWHGEYERQQSHTLISPLKECVWCSVYSWSFKVLLFTTQVDWKSTFVGLDLNDLEVFLGHGFHWRRNIWFDFVCIWWASFLLFMLKFLLARDISSSLLIKIQLRFRLMSVQLFLHIPYIWKWWFHLCR